MFLSNPQSSSHKSKNEFFTKQSLWSFSTRYLTTWMSAASVSPYHTYAWFPPFHCRSAVAVSPFPLCKFCKNYESAVRITLPTWKIMLRHCRFYLPLSHNGHSVAIGSNPIFAVLP